MKKVITFLAVLSCMSIAGTAFGAYHNDQLLTALGLLPGMLGVIVITAIYRS